MPRTRQQGGSRQGTPGTNYPNRSDMRSPKVIEFPSTQYGRGTAQQQAQRATKAQVEQQERNTLAGRGIQFDNQNVDTTGVRVATPGGVTPSPSPGPAPGTLGSLTDPTALPDQPITAGAPFGPGPGPSPYPDPDAQAIDRLRILFAQTGSPALGQLIEAWEDGQ